MKLFTVASYDDYEIEVNNSLCLKKVDYSYEEYLSFIEEAKKYYYTIVIESESTDFNDRYSSSTTYYEQINRFNIVIKDNKFYGAVVWGLGKIHSEYVVCTLDRMNYNYYDGSCYSYIERTIDLRKYDLSVEALDFVQKYYILTNVKAFKVKKEGEKLDTDSNYKYYLTAHDVILEDGKAVGLKHEGREYRLDMPGGSEHKWVEVKQYGCTYNYYYTSTIVEWGNENE